MNKGDIHNNCKNVNWLWHLMMNYSQGVHLHHPIQHPFIHECQTLAMDEGLLQD